MITTKCVIDCDGRRPSLLSDCSAKPVTLDHVPGPDELAALMIEHGYFTDLQGGGQWCRRHHPASASTLAILTREYTRVAPGILVRVTGFPWSCPVEILSVEPGTEHEYGAQ